MIKTIDGKRVIKIYNEEDGFEQHIFTDLTQEEVNDAMNGDDYRSDDFGFDEKLNQKCIDTNKTWDYIEVLEVQD